MANKNFVVKNGLTVGNLTIDADSGNINTSGSLVSASVYADSFFYANNAPFANTGYVGSQGYTGSQGDQGVQGITGYTGSKGADGIIGVDGYTGSKGDTGYTGSQGEIGYTGSKGADGIIGVDGYTGSQGVKGDTGYTGSTGYVGSKGDTGLGFTIAKTYASVAALTADTNPTNIIPGQFAIIDTGDVNDPENSRLYIWNGSTYQYVNDLSGAIGLTGPQGNLGYTGSASTVAGYVGSQGDTGYVGSQGNLGYTGSQGDFGYTGSQGIIGFVGSQGDTGFVGSQGDTGYTGSAGLLDWAVISSNYTASDKQRLILNNTVGGFTVTLPSTPATGTYIQLTDGGNLSTNNVTVDPGASTIEGVAGTIVLDVPNATFEFIYDGTTWQLTSTSGPRGLPGYTGSIGSTGIQGEIGYTGSSGIGYTGSAGINGTNGINGADGYTGSQGITGYTGSAGADGTNGGLGYTGSAGITGYTGSIGLLDWTKITNNYSASNRERLMLDSSSASFTVTLPATPANGTYIQFTDAANLATYPVTVDRNGSTIEGQANNLVLDVPNATFEFIYDGSTWQVTSTSGPKGDVGYTGSAGADGIIGYNGSVGYTGSAGADGAIGYTGSASTAIGYTGSAGIDGLIGYTGSTGAGFTGSAGYTGSQGDFGYTGSKGDSGLGFTIAKSYANVALLTADVSPSGIIAGQFAIIETGNVEDAENSRLYLWNGSSYSYVNDLSGAAGITGPQGNVGFTGSIGYTGSQGTTGFVGSQGIPGEAAAVGYTGSQGTGYTGSQGIQGQPGIASTSLAADQFTGNGSQTTFTLSVTPTGINQTLVVIDGVTQIRDTYSLSGANLTFTEAPTNGARVEVTTFVYGTTSFVNRSYTGNGSATTYTVTSGVTAESLLVTDNGIVQRPGTDYTVNNTTLTFTTAPANGANVHIRELPAGIVGAAGAVGYTGSAGTSGGSTAASVGYSLVFGL